MGAYLTIAAAVLLMGQSFSAMLIQLQGESTSEPLTQTYFITSYFWFILLLAGPVITMRLFALEKYTGTFETLMTTPIGDLQVVLAKFTAAMVFFMLMWLPSLGCVLVLRHYITNTEAFDAGLLGSTLLGIFLLGCLFMSLGCFASALTRNQITAAMISFALGFSILLVSYLSDRPLVTTGWLGDIVSQVALVGHMRDFSRGIVDTRHVVFYVTLTALFLFLTLRVVESRRWK